LAGPHHQGGSWNPPMASAVPWGILIMLTAMDMIMMAGIGLVRLMVPTGHGFGGLFLGRPCGTA